MVSSEKYIPKRGDLVWLNFTPQSGYEQLGRRPAVVISPLDYNKIVELALFCPVTNQKKGYPFEVELPHGIEVNGVILSDHINNLDWRSRGAEYICTLPDVVLTEVIGKLNTLIGI